MSVGLIHQLYEACVPPAASYGCEIWGLRKMPPGLAAKRRALSQGHLNILRQITHLRKSTPPYIVFSECDAQPLEDTRLRCVVFWNNLCELPPDSVFGQVAHESFVLAHQTQSGWVHDFFAALLAIGFPADDVPSALLRIEVSYVKLLLCGHSKRVFPESMSLFPDPRVAPSSGVILNTYLHWFRKPVWACSFAPPVAVPLSAKIVCSFIRFRSGCSGLPVDTGRWAQPRVPRSQHMCQLCPRLRAPAPFKVTIYVRQGSAQVLGLSPGLSGSPAIPSRS